jgi:prepilin-type processing-associated H-X9-DG protein
LVVVAIIAILIAVLLPAVGSARGTADRSGCSGQLAWTGAVPQLVPWWRGTANSSLVLAADIGPSLSLPDNDPRLPAGTRESNSKNHGGLGQNVLFADGHVSFNKGSDVGPAGDCIYTATATAGTIYCNTGGTRFNISAPVTNLNSDPEGGDLILAPGRP